MVIVDSARQQIDFGHDVGRIKYCIATVGDGVETRESSLPNAGYGLFATRDFEPWEIVTFYDGAVGERIPVTEIEPSYRTHARRLNSYYTIYGNYTHDGTPIDLTKNGAKGMGGGAFINTVKAENEGVTDLNCAWYVIRSYENLPRMDKSEDPFQIINLIYTKRAITAGSEFFIDYGQDYWRQEEETTTTTEDRQKPVFITHASYYASLKGGELTTTRTIKRVTPTLVSPPK